MLWACLHFPALALNRVEQSLPQPKAVVIEITRKQRRLVLQANAQAHAAGIVPGMTIPTAQGLCADLYCVEYDPDAEFKALQQLGHWAYGFTPHIQTHQGAGAPPSSHHKRLQYRQKYIICSCLHPTLKNSTNSSLVSAAQRKWQTE